jgi:hypothetical protein
MTAVLGVQGAVRGRLLAPISPEHPAGEDLRYIVIQLGGALGVGGCTARVP